MSPVSLDCTEWTGALYLLVGSALTSGLGAEVDETGVMSHTTQ